MLLTLPGSIVRTEPASFTLSKSELMALAQVSADSFFSAPGKAKKAVFVFESTVGEQLAFLSFDLSQENPQSSVVFSSTARSSFELKRVILRDSDRGRLIIPRSALPSGLDLSITDAAQGGGSSGGGSTPSGPSMITSGLIVQLESETLESGQWGPQWTDAISLRGFYPMSAGMGGGNASIQAGAFGARSGMRLQGGMKMPENIGFGSSLLQSAASLTVLVVAAGSAENEILTLTSNGLPYASIKSSTSYPYMGGGMPMQRASLEAFGEFSGFSMGGPSEIVTTNAASYSAGSAKVMALTMPGRSSVGSKFFLNGTEATAGAQSNAMSGISLGSDALVQVGGYYPTMNQDVTVGAVLIYDRVLSDAELSELSAFMMARYSVA